MKKKCPDCGCSDMDRMGNLLECPSCGYVENEGKEEPCQKKK